MAKFETDKEDLIADATALVERAEFIPAADVSLAWKTVTIGFRKDGCLSLYFDQDPFYQFDKDGGLRRAHVAGLLYRSQGVTLARLERKRTLQHTVLQRADLSSPKLEEFRRQLVTCLADLLQALSANDLECSRAVPEGLCLRNRVVEFLNSTLARGSEFLSRSIRKRN